MIVRNRLEVVCGEIMDGGFRLLLDDNFMSSIGSIVQQAPLNNVSKALQ